MPESELDPVTKPLYSDACSGVIFNLGCDVLIGAECLPKGVFLMPVSQVAHTIQMPPGARLAGIRFHPAAGYAVFGEQHKQHIQLLREDNCYASFHCLFDSLTEKLHADCQIKVMQQWCEERWGEESQNNTEFLPAALEKAFDRILCGERPGQLEAFVGLSQRQIERMFNTWLGMTPKHYQRIQRVRLAVQFLKAHPEADLAGVAADHGFSDQAHMTREFKKIARITPGGLLPRK